MPKTLIDPHRAEDKIKHTNKRNFVKKLDIIRDAARLGVEIVRMYATAIGSNPGKPYDKMTKIERNIIFDKVFILYEKRDISPSMLHAMAVTKLRSCNSEKAKKSMLREWSELPEYIRMMDILFVDAVSAYLSFGFGDEPLESDFELLTCCEDENLKEKLGKVVLFFNRYQGDLAALVDMVNVCGFELFYRKKDALAVVQNRAIQKCLHNEEELNKLVGIADKYFASIGANLSSSVESQHV